MSLVAAGNLDANKFFKSGQPEPQGSSFDLTIGQIIDDKGKKVAGPFTIKPGQMVQVVSSEAFNLSAAVTGHVTYKTTLTRKGIWALTVGIVDPGWDGPIATTLLNFSRIDYTIAKGDAFLRVSFFEHAAVPQDKLRKAPPLDAYLKDVQKSAASAFPLTFLNTEAIAEAAGRKVMDLIKTQALVWVAGIALLFTVGNMIALRFERTQLAESTLRQELLVMQAKLTELERASRLASPVFPAPPVSAPDSTGAPAAPVPPPPNKPQ